MAERLKIKLSIADRVYPLTIDPSQEEGLRKAAKNIEQLAKKFEELPAAGDAAVVILIIALVVLVLELAGITDIFTGI